MRIRDIIYPAKCVFCGSVHTDDTGICDYCRSALPYVTEPTCTRCGKPIADAESEMCLDCERKATSALEAGTAVWVYTDETKAAMVDFKYGGCMSDAFVYASEMADRCGDFFNRYRPQAIVPVPIHRRRAWFRGYNQAELLAVELGRKLDIPVMSLIRRSVYTTPLKELAPDERKKALSQAFEIDPEVSLDISGLDRVLLVDDIYTTGSTVEVCAQLLSELGIGHIYAAYLCIGRDF